MVGGSYMSEGNGIKNLNLKKRKIKGIICSSCDGRGIIILGWNKYLCFTCNGKGWIKNDR